MPLHLLTLSLLIIFDESNGMVINIMLELKLYCPVTAPTVNQDHCVIEVMLVNSDLFFNLISKVQREKSC
jgi:hypothetical protein